MNSSTTDPTLQERLEQACSTIAGHAISVDRTGAFPEQSIAALRSAGLLGALTAARAGGLELGLDRCAGIVSRVAEECGSTAMVLTMHYCAAAVLEAHGSEQIRRSASEQLATLAFSEAGSRSHFWAPVSTAEARNGHIVLNASKSWVTSASRAVWFVWSSKPLSTEGLSTLWLVPGSTEGLQVHGPFEGLGLRGNDSSPISASNASIDPSAMLGKDGEGFASMMNTVLPVFSVLNAACSNGLMAGALRRTIAHVTATRHTDTGTTLADLPTIRAYIARMRTKLSMSETLLADTVKALGAQRPDATLRVLECKAAAGETSGEVLDLAMRVCGGAAFRKEVGVERFFRDARAAGVMAPTTDLLYDFIGKAVCGMPLF